MASAKAVFPAGPRTTDSARILPSNPQPSRWSSPPTNSGEKTDIACRGKCVGPKNNLSSSSDHMNSPSREVGESQEHVNPVWLTFLRGVTHSPKAHGTGPSDVVPGCPGASAPLETGIQSGNV